MNQQEIIKRTQQFIRDKFDTESSGHDYWHMYRVWELAKRITATEKGADLFIVELAALLHDISDWKFNDGDMEAGPNEASKFLKSLRVNNVIIEHIEDIIRNVSFKGARVESNLTTLEGQIVHDADKLDAIGAIGIGRTFAYGGAIG